MTDPYAPGPGVVVHVRLTDAEMAMADLIHRLREEDSQARGLRHRDSMAVTGPLTRGARTLNGVRGELAGANGLGLYWPGGIGTFHGADVPPDWQIRTRDPASFRDPGLCFRPDDNPEHSYMLVLGTGREFALIGWMKGRDCINGHWRGQSGGNLVYYVPQPALRPVWPHA